MMGWEEQQNKNERVTRSHTSNRFFFYLYYLSNVYRYIISQERYIPKRNKTQYRRCTTKLSSVIQRCSKWNWPGMSFFRAIKLLIVDKCDSILYNIIIIIVYITQIDGIMEEQEH